MSLKDIRERMQLMEQAVTRESMRTVLFRFYQVKRTEILVLIREEDFKGIIDEVGQLKGAIAITFDNGGINVREFARMLDVLNRLSKEADEERLEELRKNAEKDLVLAFAVL